MTAEAMTLAGASKMDDRTSGGGRPTERLRASEMFEVERCAGATAASSKLRRAYLRGLAVAFAVFSSVRVLTYLPTIWAIHAVGDSGQYSVWTWVAWIGGNVSMAAWLYENNGQRVDSAVVVTIANALMCLATCATIVYYRL